MRVRVGFPLRSEGHLGRAVALASRHPTYRVEGVNGSARVCVDLDLPSDWRLLDDFSGLLRGEVDTEYAADGASLSADELFGGLRCFLRKQRSGRAAREWCTPVSLADKQLFPCRQIRVYDNDHLTANSWYAFGKMDDEAVFEVDKEAITERVLSDLGPCVRCPILDLDSTAEIVARLPERIDPSRDHSWGYREDGDLSGWKVVKTREGREEADCRRTGRALSNASRGACAVGERGSQRRAARRLAAATCLPPATRTSAGCARP